MTDDVTSFDDFIKVEVSASDTLKTYTIHRNLFTARSMFFRKALSGSWVEAENRVVRLNDSDIEVFETYVHLVYHNELTCVPDLPSDLERTVATQSNLAKLYVLCEMLQDVRAKNCIVQALMCSIYKIRDDGKWTIPRRDMIEIIYEGTVKGNPARRALLDVFTYGVRGEWMSMGVGPLESYPAEFLQELAVSIINKCPPAEHSGGLFHSASEDHGAEYMEEAEVGERS